ncbi:hypothetical protein [Sinorhizobium medicae]|uniref:hypothetical protein n=1 Tax=Sinorhizobium medicae TaxID=110321 RepID=UPI000C79B717|nr:hypothetical protein [Sinorhizobium medicae]PLU25736.1 hypothetical protein BMJ28_33530 [Sinorhizobium medicae]
MSDHDEADERDRLKRGVRSVFNAVLAAANKDPAVYWPAANYLVAYAVLQERTHATECAITHPDARVAFAFRSGWTRLEELRREGVSPLPLIARKMRQFHQGRLTAALPAETAGALRKELDLVLRSGGPASFEEMLAAALH